MTQPVPNLQSPIVDKDTGYIINPWNIWFQQFSEPPNKTLNVIVKPSPFSYKANRIGNVVINGGTVSLIQLIRGTTILNLFTDTIGGSGSTGIRLVPVSIGDIVKITYFPTAPIVQFLEQ